MDEWMDGWMNGWMNGNVMGMEKGKGQRLWNMDKNLIFW